MRATLSFSNFYGNSLMVVDIIKGVFVGGIIAYKKRASIFELGKLHEAMQCEAFVYVGWFNFSDGFTA